ncbi:hypothetical protein Clacol_003571 [Clathrus columnatus]|uniref:Uncharacterized protein n=1 Tax=Clathrus columnatus TaxID=1419009 RepID=A0AAV5A7X1_9AGAM|nr:hypothetical protein Clacol_003571 [Clathrus columnatus]
MNPFGIISKCPTCDKNVYAAEQVLDVECITSFASNASLAQRFSLLETFENMTLSQICHIREFSTQDLRFANVLPPSPTRRARESMMSTPPPPIRVTRLDDEEDAIYEEDEELNEEKKNTDEHSGDEPDDDAEEESQLPEEHNKSHNYFANGHSSTEPTQDRLQITRSPSPTKLMAASPSLSPATTTTTTADMRIRSSQNPLRTYSARTGIMRPISPTITGMSTASAPMGYLRTNMTGSSSIGQTFTGTLGKSATGTQGRRHTYTPPGFSGTPSCPRCEKPLRSLSILTFRSSRVERRGIDHAYVALNVQLPSIPLALAIKMALFYVEIVIQSFMDLLGAVMV